MLNIAKLFGKSPFSPLQKHIEKVAFCIEKLPLLFEAIEKKDEKEINSISKNISKLEYEADLTKNDIRNHLPRSLFLPINRGDLLEILHLQDSLADQAEDIASVSTLKLITNYKDLKDLFNPFYKENIEAFNLLHKIILELDTLLESSFGGIEAEKVKDLIQSLAKKEHEIDLLQYQLLKMLYNLTDTMDYSIFHIWTVLIKETAQISNISEKLGNRIRMILEIK